MVEESLCADRLACVQGPSDPPLWSLTLGEILLERAKQFDQKPAIIFPWQGVQLSFTELAQQSKQVAVSLLHAGIHPGDCVGVIAGNRYEYLEIVAGGALIGCRVLVLNNTYRPLELHDALRRTDCRILFLAPTIGSRSLAEHVDLLGSPSTRFSLPELTQIVFLGESPQNFPFRHRCYEDFKASVTDNADNWTLFESQSRNTKPSDILSLQLTSGTTGKPKVAMLTHLNMINNARFVGQRLDLTSADVICCPPPLFHCFGLVMGFMTSLIHGSTIVFPSDHFNADLVIDSVHRYCCTTLLGVPTMFIAELEICQSKETVPSGLRKGLIAGSTISQTLVDRLSSDMGLGVMVIAYGMTETGPVSFMTSSQDAPDKRIGTVGRAMPHTQAKVIDRTGQLVHRGMRGELCVSGHGLQAGYLNNQAKTKEVMRLDETGTMWMHTGDECIIDDSGYCRVTGRIKDIIIRGGENIFPAEIEERLIAHPSIVEASVVGVPDAKYGEVVASFVKTASQRADRPDPQEIQNWVRKALSKSKTPQYLFWVGEGEVCQEFPTTGSGKHQKHLLREIANQALRRSRTMCENCPPGA